MLVRELLDAGNDLYSLGSGVNDSMALREDDERFSRDIVLLDGLS